MTSTFTPEEGQSNYLHTPMRSRVVKNKLFHVCQQMTNAVIFSGKDSLTVFILVSLVYT